MYQTTKNQLMATEVHELTQKMFKQ